MDPMAKPKGRSAGTAAVGRIRWLDEVADHDYAAAEADLSPKLDKPAVTRVVSRLRKAPLRTRRANDILRAAGVAPAPLDDPRVMKDLIKVIEGKRRSPVLVVRGDAGADIADGLHRVSLVYRIDPYEELPLKVA